MTDVYFIEAADIKKTGTIDKNVDDTLINQSIIDAQNIDLHPILGTRLLLSLADKVSGNTISGETNYYNLMINYIQPSLVKFVSYRCSLYQWIKFKNTSVVRESYDRGNSVDYRDLKVMRTDFLNDSQYYANELRNYLIENKNLYSEYQNYNPDGKVNYKTPRQETNYFQGLHLKSK